MAALAGIFVPTLASADAGEWLLSAELGGALYSGGASPSFGGGGEVSALTGLDDRFWLGLAGGVTTLAEGPFRVHGVGELALLFDVLRTVPFVSLGLGVETYDGRSSPLLRAGLGADHFISADWALGAVVRYQPAFGDELEHLVTLSFRLVFRPFD